MQLAFSCTPQTYANVEKSLSAARLARYLPAAQGDRDLALRLYFWNAQLCEALYFPAQIAEIAFRNAIQRSLQNVFSSGWHTQTTFLATLPSRLHQEIRTAGKRERGTRVRPPTDDQMVSALTYGFWLSFLTQRYRPILWGQGFQSAFPNAQNMTRQNLYDAFDRLRITRNRIAHHKPIFDRNPSGDYQNILRCTRVICDDTAWLISQMSRVSQTINARPRL